MKRSTIGSVMEPKRNGLNLVRLVMALGVILYHSYPITGRDIGSPAMEQLLGQVWVDGFFTMSGFLIVGSWLRRPNAWSYIRHRLLRIYPAFAVCLAATAFGFAPLAAFLDDEVIQDGEQLRYLGSNMGIYIRDYGISNTLTSVPYQGVWNGSLWTLFWELLCYIGVLVLGVAGILRHRWTIPVTFAVAYVIAALGSLTPLGEKRIPLLMARIAELPVDTIGRFMLCFAAGALIYTLRDRLPCNWWATAASIGIVLISMTLADYRLTAAPFLAHGLICVGALTKKKSLILRNDVSYGTYIYAFPVQQLLATSGLISLPVWWFALTAATATTALASASWFMVERPALRLKG